MFDVIIKTMYIGMSSISVKDFPITAQLIGNYAARMDQLHLYNALDHASFRLQPLKKIVLKCVKCASVRNPR